jgi:DNA-binding CsgD family transcriptional regulator
MRIGLRALDELLERDSELASFAAVAELARSGSGSLLVIEGPAGIGKTRLIEAALVHGDSAGLETASAKGSELEREFPFGVARQLLEPLVASIPVKDRPEVLAGPASLGASALSDLRPESSPTTEASYATLHGLYWLTASIAARRPLLIAVDDAHWSDAPSLRFLAYLVKRIEGVPASILLATRSAEPGAEVVLLEEIASDSAAKLLRPLPLSEAAVGEQVRSSLSQDADESFCSACHRASGGNPFLLRELLRALAEEEVSATADQTGRVSDVAPDTVARSVLRRLGRLPEPATTLARAVAVLGDRAELQLAAQLADLDDLSAAEIADELARIDILQPGRPLAFSHPIVRAAVYSSWPRADRARAHRRAAQLLVERGGDLDRVATHLLATEAADDRWTLDVLREAGRAAVARGAPEIGATYLERALSERLTDNERADFLVELGAAEVAARPPPAGIEHMRQALALATDDRKRALISLELGRALFAMVDFPAAAEVLEQALSELGGEHRELAERLEALLITACATSLRTVPRAHKRLASLLRDAEAGKLTDPSLLATVAVFATCLREPAAGGAKLARDALAGGRLVADQDMVALPFAACALMFADELDAALAVWEDALATARRSGSVAMFVFASAFRSQAAWRIGSIPTAEADARAALGVGAVREAQFGLPFVVGVLVDALVERGELEAAAQTLTESGVEGPLPELLHLNFVLDSRGRLRLAQGRAREALDDFQECGRREQGWGMRNPGSVTWRSSAALALSSLGDSERALELALEEVELARRFEVPRALGIALRATGLIEGGEGGIARLRDAVEVLEGSPAALERARALTDLGAAVRRSGMRSEARPLLRRGLDLAQRCGATATAERALAELLATGARPRRTALTGVDALTASERRVAEMAAEGLTNREIAQALFVTEKTVEWHLGQAYRKLEISSRSELAGALAPPIPDAS